MLRKIRDTKGRKKFEDKLNEEVLERAKIIHISFVTMTLHPPHPSCNNNITSSIQKHAVLSHFHGKNWRIAQFRRSKELVEK